jgi:hypothetical protein
LSWPGITSAEGRFASTVYRYGRKEIGHLHRDGVADLPFPKDIHDELLSNGQAFPHRAGSAGFVSYYIRGPEDVERALELFRMNYDRARQSAERRGVNPEDEKGQPASGEDPR